MDKIRIGGHIKRIEVNDEGEFITLPLSDDGFVLNFYKLMDNMKQSGAELASREDIAGDGVKGVEEIIALEQDTKEKVDALFGDGTCQKVFGNVLPSMDLFVEFFGSLVPFFEEYKNDRMKKMGKYDAHRTGSAV